MAELIFTEDREGNLSISDRVFEGESFTSISLAPVKGTTIVMRDTKFINCSTNPGTCVISKGVILDHVEFIDFRCGDALRISLDASLNEVAVTGNYPAALLVQPESREGLRVTPSEGSCQLDISRFLGRVSIIGLPGNAVRKDSERHVCVKASWQNDVQWKSLNIGPSSYWRIFVKKLQVFKVSEGVFSLPRDKYSSETLAEMLRLEQAGISFD